MNPVIAAIDFSDVTESIVAHACALARMQNAPLYLVHVEAPEPEFVGFEPGPQYVRDRTAEEITRDHEQLIALRDRCRNNSIDTHSLLVQGPIAAKLLDEAKRLDAAYIVLGSRGRGALAHVLLGSVSTEVVRGAPCPVLVIPGGAQ